MRVISDLLEFIESPIPTLSTTLMPTYGFHSWFGRPKDKALSPPSAVAVVQVDGLLAL
jgi:hypothetical protein